MTKKSLLISSLVPTVVVFAASSTFFLRHNYVYVLSILNTVAASSLAIYLIIALRKNIGMPLLGLGALSNELVKVVNNFSMPVSDYNSKEGLHIGISDTTNLRFLGDIFTVEINNYEFMISIGDILVTIGLIIFLMLLLFPLNSCLKKLEDFSLKIILLRSN